MDILKDTDNVKNILSFGARNGGFELAMQIRHDLDQLTPPKQDLNNRLSQNYLDAVSLQSHRHTQLQKLDGIDVFKMQNPFWDIGYKNGIENAEKMVFLITPEWLNSTFCQQELSWLKESDNENINVAFVISPDAEKNHPIMPELVSLTEKKQALYMELTAGEHAPLPPVHIENSQPLSFRHSISSTQFQQLTNWLKLNRS